MSPEKENPCKFGLTPDCFQTFPEFAGRALALRLLYLLVPFQLTSRLPGKLREPLIFPGVTFPPGWQIGDPWPSMPFLWEGLNLPGFELLIDGLIVLPGTTFPSDWQPGDPPPAGISIKIGVFFPTGWQPGDPPPAGVIVPPATVFPPDWQPADPLPDGALPPGSLPEDAQDTGPLPPSSLTPSPSELPGTPISSKTVKGVYEFFDDFTVLDLTEWSTTISQEGTIDIVDEHLRMKKIGDQGFASITRADPTALLSVFYVSFDLLFISGSSTLRFDYWTGTYYLYFLFQLPKSLKIWTGSDWDSFTLSDFTNIEHKWRFWVSGFGCKIYRNGDHVASTPTIAADSFPSGTHRFVLANTGDLRIDNFKLRGM